MGDSGACFPCESSIHSTLASACLAPSGSSLATQEILPVSEIVLLSAVSMSLLGQSLIAIRRGETPGASAGVETRASATPPRELFSSSKHADSRGYHGPHLALEPLWRTEDRDTACHRSSARLFSSTGGVLRASWKFSSLVAQETAQETGHKTILG